jgi:arylsulfatase A-like enzyme
MKTIAHTKTHRILLVIIPFVFFQLFFVSAAHAKIDAAQKPNIVLVLADDIGVGDISFYTEQLSVRKPVFRTPNIDSLAEKGLWFSDAHSATALCAPTRYAVMTGKNNYRSYAPWGVWGSFQPSAFKVDEPNLANVAKNGGYATSFVGKWHLGGDFAFTEKEGIYRGTDEGNLTEVDLSKQVAGGPNDLGFDYSYMLPNGIQGPLYLAYENQQWSGLSDSSSIVYFDEKTVPDPIIISDKGDGMADSAWRTENIGNIISQKAVQSIKSTPAKQPLFLFYASPMAHLPHVPPTLFDGKKVAGHTPSKHLDMVYELDLQVGRIIQALKDTARYDNTIFIFTSDNGGLTYRVPGTLESGHKPSEIYRSSKNAPHEGGHRVPFIVSWPAKMSQAKKDDSLVLVQDILASIADVVGQQIDQQAFPDSKSFFPLLQSENAHRYQARTFAMLQGGSRNEVIYRQGDWKLIINSNHKLSKFEPVALFNLKDNISELEKDNLIDSVLHQKRVSLMFQQYMKTRGSLQATAY